MPIDLYKIILLKPSSQKFTLQYSPPPPNSYLQSNTYIERDEELLLHLGWGEWEMFLNLLAKSSSSESLICSDF